MSARALAPAEKGALAALLAAMLTRLPLFAGFLHVSDASWAVFFLAGFYLRDRWRWAFALFMAIAVSIDLAAIEWMGVPNYCLTVAYWFVVPGYASLWVGGAWLSRRFAGDLRGAGRALCAVIVAASVCFLVTNASFYWLGGRVDPTWDGWLANFMRWYWPFVRTTLVYASAVLLVHGVLARQPWRRLAKQ